MQADIEHAGREQAGIVDAHGVHPALAELHVARLAGLGLLRGAQRIARHAAAHVLGEAGMARHDGAARGAGAAPHGDLAQHVVFHVGEDFREILVLVVVRIHVDDQHVVEIALHRLLAGVRQQPGGVQLVDRYASAAFSEQVHGCLLSDLLCGIGALACSAAGPALPHAELEHGQIGGAQQAARRDHHFRRGDAGALRRAPTSDCRLRPAPHRSCTPPPSGPAGPAAQQVEMAVGEAAFDLGGEPSASAEAALVGRLAGFAAGGTFGLAGGAALGAVCSACQRAWCELGGRGPRRRHKLRPPSRPPCIAQLQAAVGDAFAGLHVVFVAVPGADEMHLGVREVQARARSCPA